MTKKHRYVLGKVDYNGSGRRNCKAALTWSFENGCFRMQGEIWNPRETDAYRCGQCVDTVASYFPEDAKAQRMLAIWREWHLNDLTAYKATWVKRDIPADVAAEIESWSRQPAAVEGSGVCAGTRTPGITM